MKKCIYKVGNVVIGSVAGRQLQAQPICDASYPTHPNWPLHYIVNSKCCIGYNTLQSLMYTHLPCITCITVNVALVTMHFKVKCMHTYPTQLNQPELHCSSKCISSKSAPGHIQPIAYHNITMQCTQRTQSVSLILTQNSNLSSKVQLSSVQCSVM